MLTNLPEDETVLFHPIVFFDQGTYFFETRRRLDGQALLGCGSAVSSEPNGAGIVIDPLDPRRRLDATCALARPPTNGRREWGEAARTWMLRCPAIARGSWGLLAMLGSEEMERVKAAAGVLPEKPAGFADEEWLLRQAFSDERVRENSLLAATLARLPIIFARATAGEIQFQLPLIQGRDENVGSICRFVAVVDAGLPSICSHLK